MIIKKYEGEQEDLELDLFINSVFAYESDLIEALEKAINIGFKGFRKAFEIDVPTNEDLMLEFESDIQLIIEKRFCITAEAKEVFCDFQYSIDEFCDKIYFQSQCILNVFSKYLLSTNMLEFDHKDPVFDFLYYLYYSEEKDHKDKAWDLMIEFVMNLYYYMIYRDYIRLKKFFNRDFLVSPNDNHIPIRIALLNSLNLISELNNTVPNKENIYRIVHAIVGGNEDNVKKYCLSLIGQSSTSQKQITKKHKEFAQKYINERKL